MTVRNTELNDLRKLFISEKLKFLLKKFHFIKPMTMWRIISEPGKGHASFIF